jgi:GNAT superfamily N-acetyltransferase
MRCTTPNLAVDVKPVTRRDVPLLEADLPFGVPEKHADRSIRQGKGQVVYLIAWYNGAPIGHALLKWQGAEEDQVVSALQGMCPDVEDLLVLESFRSQGVGRQILDAAERLACERGFPHIGLSVGAGSPRARSLYEHLGYRDAGLGPLHEHLEYLDASGQRQTWDETCVYLTKSLQYL